VKADYRDVVSHRLLTAKLIRGASVSTIFVRLSAAAFLDLRCDSS
jgi:hypothetical protein